jgi:hypothetical protein
MIASGITITDIGLYFAIVVETREDATTFCADGRAVNMK